MEANHKIMNKNNCTLKKNKTIENLIMDFYCFYFYFWKHWIKIKQEKANLVWIICWLIFGNNLGKNITILLTNGTVCAKSLKVLVLDKIGLFIFIEVVWQGQIRVRRLLAIYFPVWNIIYKVFFFKLNFAF